jgi:ABC-2 type transport system permease protein
MKTGTTIPFGSLFLAEFRKATDTRAGRWLLAAAVLLALAAEAVPLAFPHDVTQNRASFLTWAALGLSRLLPIALMLTMTAEWSQRTALTTFTLEPRRGRVLAGKVLAGLTLSVIGGCLAFGIAEAGVAVARASGRHPAVGWNWPELAGFAAFVMLTSGTGVAIGSALHNTAAAIVTYFALAGAASLLLIPAVQRAGDWVNTGQTFGWVLTGQWSGHGPQIASSAVIWIAVPFAIGTVRTIRRDVR